MGRDSQIRLATIIDFMEDIIKQLQASPENWELRCSVARQFYENEQFDEAARYISEASEIPGGEDDVLFAATILGASDPELGCALLDQFLESNTESAAAQSLKSQLLELQQEDSDIPVARVVETVKTAAPQKLQPPGKDPESEAPAGTPTPLPSASAAEVPLITRSQPLAGEEIADAGIERAHELEGEGRAFIVAEGGAVHAAEKVPETKNKLEAVGVALIVNLGLLLALSLWGLASPRPSPPQISVSSLANADESSLENQTMVKMEQRSAAAVTSSQPVVASDAFSSFAVPDIVSTDNNLDMVSMSSGDAGFGMSMSGFSDVSNMGAIPAGMRSRCSMSQRMKRLRESGGEDRAERAVRNGLNFLSGHQDKKTGSIGSNYKVGITGLSLLAFLGHCETPESPKFGDTVVNATLYLMDRAKKNDGWISVKPKKDAHGIYEHSIGIYALSELYTMTRESGKEVPHLESVLKRAVSQLVDGQTKSGGWAYANKSNGTEDGSVSMWCFQALKAAHNTGRKFSGVDRALDKMVDKYLPANQDSQGAFKYHMNDAQGKPTLTGAGLLGLELWGKRDSSIYKKGLGYLNSKYANPSPGGNYYAPYYNTQVYFLHEGKEWENYNKKFQPKLLDAQNDDGSWLKPKAGGKDGIDNQLMNTAWAILMLEVYYRYLPTTDKVKGLKPH